jgi:LTXXQ motif family protein
MNRYLVAPLTVLALCASPVVLTAAAAQNDQTSAAPNMERMQRVAADRQTVLDAKLTGMKAELKLTADQEKLWGPFESAVRDTAKTHMDEMQQMMENRESGQHMSPIDRLDMIADRLSKAAADVKKVADSAKPLYASLDDSQKHSFATLGRMLMPERARMAGEMWRHRMGEGMEK